MKVNLLSFNVCGLNDLVAVETPKLYIQDFRPKIDVLLTQEHKLGGSAVTSLGSTL
jgi:hypothetical protein